MRAASIHTGESSGSVLADKRYLYGEALMAAGEAQAAADLFAQAAEQAPTWAPAYLAQGLALEQAGCRDDALAAFRRAAAHDRNGTLGAALHVARLGGEPIGEIPPSYVALLFDQYAARFDAHLVGTLAYRGPAVILDALAALPMIQSFAPALDLGCGTGLMARALAATVDIIDGIDVSPRMIVEAETTGLYRTLHVGDAVDTMHRMPAAKYGLAVAADVLVYVGDLAPLFNATARVLRQDGVFAATVQAGEEPYQLGPDLRFRHGPDYLRQTLARAGFARPSLQPCVTRREGGRDVPGLVLTAQRS